MPRTISSEERRRMLTDIHAQFPEVDAKWDKRRVRIEFHEEFVLFSVEVHQHEPCSPAMASIEMWQFEQINDTLTMGAVYDRALAELEKELDLAKESTFYSA